MTSPDSRQVTVEVDGRVAAVADVTPTPDPAVVRSAMHVEPGHLPPGTRAKLVDAVLDAPEVSSAERLSASMPAGDPELVEGLRQRAERVDIRRAGATKLVEAQLRSEER